MDVVIESKRENPQEPKLCAESSQQPRSHSIPVISMTKIKNGCKQTQQQLGDALMNVGFFALVDHGISNAVINSAYEQAKQLFALPRALKLECARPDLGGQVGFTDFFQEVAKDATSADLKEYWHIMRPHQDTKTASLVPENVWPLASRLEEEGISFNVGYCRTQLLQLFYALDEVSKIILQGVSRSIQEPSHFLPDLVKGGFSVLRLLHYPEVSQSDYPGSIRAAAHEDINLITLLVNATGPGLELLQSDGTWLAVTAPDDAIIVDSADMLSNLTNGLIKATTHRVVNHDETGPRYSMPFFVHPRPEVSLKPTPHSVTLNPNGAGRDITAKAFLRERLIEIGVLKNT